MNELSIALDSRSGEHLYEQIYEYIKNEIMKGKLPAGEKLPSTRNLAEFLQISRTTVDLAYGQLVSEGYIEARPYKGYFVCKVEELFHMKENLHTKAVCERDEQEPEFDFSPHGIDMSCFPFSTWKKISKDIFAERGADLFKPGGKQGDADFRETICRYLHSARGVECEPDQIIIGAGNDYLLLLLSKILSDRSVIAMERFTYRKAYLAFAKSGFPMRVVDFDEYGMDVTQLSGCGADVAYVMPSHQFPTGIVMPIGRRMELLNWAAQAEGRFLIEDDYDSEFRYKGKPVPALWASDRNGRVIYIGTFSKSIAPSIRVSFMVIPRKLLPRYEQTCGFLSCTVSRIDQAILNMFISQGHYERYLNKMRKVYKSKHDVLLEELSDVEEHFEILGENAGLHILLKSRKNDLSQELKKTACKNGILVQTLDDYCIDPGKGQKEYAYVLLGYGSLSEAAIREGIRKLKEIWMI